MLSVVLPAHDEAGVIDATLTRIAALDPELTERIEVIVVSDGSTDATFEDACEGLGRGLEGRVVELAANVGAHAAIRCGLRYARGDLVALMSADGQDPPEALPAMLERFSPELDVVWGWRRERRNDGGSARFAAAAFYRFFRLLTGLDYPPSGLDFLIVRRRVIDAVLQHSTRNTSLHLLIYNLGFAQAFMAVRPRPASGRTLELDVAQAPQARRRHAHGLLGGADPNRVARRHPGRAGGHRARRRDAGAGRLGAVPGLRVGVAHGGQLLHGRADARGDRLPRRVRMADPRRSARRAAVHRGAP